MNNWKLDKKISKIKKLDEAEIELSEIFLTTKDVTRLMEATEKSRDKAL